MIDQSDNVIKLNSINRRMFILAAAKVIILGGIVSRLFYLQIRENKKYLTLSDNSKMILILLIVYLKLSTCSGIK